jgi:hypothetical protein
MQKGPSAQDPKIVLRLLVEAALSLRAMEPWRWMREDDLFGIVDPETGVLNIAAILGKADGPPGLVLYRGEPGYRFLFRKQEDPGSPIDQNIAMEEDSLLVEYVTNSQLQEADKSLLTTAGIAIPPPKSKRKQAGTPRFRSHLPAHLPVVPDVEECRLLTTTLVLAQAFTSLVEENPDFYGNRPYEEIPVYRRMGNQEDSPWKLDWITLEFPPIEPAPPFSPDPKDAAAIGATQLSQSVEWELETYFPPTVLNGENRPYFPRACILANSRDGKFLDILLTHPSQSAGELAGRALTQLILRERLRPGVLWVSQPETAEALWEFAERWSIRLRFRSTLRALIPIREYLASKFLEGKQPPPKA